MFNEISIQGRLTEKPELKVSKNGDGYCCFSVACERNGKKGDEKVTDFFNCSAWRGTAKFISQYFDKGDMILLSGTLRNNSYEKNGEKRTATQIVVNKAYFTGNKGKKSEAELPELDLTPEEYAEGVNEDGIPF